MPNTFVPEGDQNPVVAKVASGAVDVDQELPTGFDFKSKPADFELWGPPSGLKPKK